MNASVRQATIHDLDAVAPLFDAYRQFYRQPGDIDRAREFLRERFAHHQSTILLALDAHEAVIGFTQLYPLFSSVRCTRIYLLNDLYVTPAVRRGGIGSSLLTAAREFARTNGAASLALTTGVDNVTAQSLYASLGWQRVSGEYEYHLPIEP